jgi:hypothetical protein
MSFFKVNKEIKTEDLKLSDFNKTEQVNLANKKGLSS